MCRRHERDADDLILQAILEIRSGLAVEDWKESLEAAQPDIDIDPEDPDPNSEWRTGLDHWVCLGHVPPKWIKLVRLDNTGIVAGGVEWHQRFGASGRSEAGERSFQAEEPQMPMADASTVGCRNGIAAAQYGNFMQFL